MVTLRRAAEQALAAIKSANQVNYSWACVEAVAALETALAEDALQRLTDVQQEIEAALAEPNKCTHGVTDGNCKECYMAESEQEPVAWMDREGDLYKMPEIKNWAPPHKMLYTAPPQRKPLTDEELEVLWDDATDRMEHFCSQYWDFARAIEAAHGIGEKHE